MIGLLPTYRLPAEWEPQRGVLLTWPHAGTDWLYCLDDITETFIQMADAITHVAQLIIATPEAESVAAILRSRLSGEQMTRINFCHCPTDDTWARDHGPITLVAGTTTDEAREHAPLHLDFHFNGWGEKFPADSDNAITSHLMEQELLGGTLESHDDFVLEGGSIETDGHGTLFTTSCCLLAPHRNQPLTQGEIEEQLRIRLRCHHVIWIDHGMLEGDDTDGHIDTLVRCAPNDTLVYVGCDDEAYPYYESLKSMEEQLRSLHTDSGHPYHLLRLPMPDACYEDDTMLPATYANFLVINGTVIYPTYNQPQHDDEARRVIAQAFPGYTLVPIDSCTIIRQHGSIHCLTMQYP